MRCERVLFGQLLDELDDVRVTAVRAQGRVRSFVRADPVAFARQVRGQHELSSGTLRVLLNQRLDLGLRQEQARIQVRQRHDLVQAILHVVRGLGEQTADDRQRFDGTVLASQAEGARQASRGQERPLGLEFGHELHRLRALCLGGQVACSLQCPQNFGAPRGQRERGALGTRHDQRLIGSTCVPTSSNGERSRERIRRIQGHDIVDRLGLERLQGHRERQRVAPRELLERHDGALRIEEAYGDLVLLGRRHADQQEVPLVEARDLEGEQVLDVQRIDARRIEQPRSVPPGPRGAQGPNLDAHVRTIEAHDRGQVGTPRRGPDATR